MSVVKMTNVTSIKTGNKNCLQLGSFSRTRNRRYNIDTTAKQVAMVWACAAKRRQLLGEEMYGI